VVITSDTGKIFSKANFVQHVTENNAIGTVALPGISILATINSATFTISTQQAAFAINPSTGMSGLAAKNPVNFSHLRHRLVEKQTNTHEHTTQYLSFFSFLLN
jgi:hypothetical protein